MLLKLTTKNGIPETWSIVDFNKDVSHTYIKVSLWKIHKLPKYFKKIKVLRWRLCFHNKILTFFEFFGSQNDYLFPWDGCLFPEHFPFQKPHLWKTRLGIKTSWDLARAIHKQTWCNKLH